MYDMAKSKYIEVGGCACPRGIAPALIQLQEKSGCTFNSIYRGEDAADLLHSLGKSTQEELYEGFSNGLPGFLPANRPGTSTHELCSDGVAYPGPSGRKLDDWQVGFDIDPSEIPKVIAAAVKIGFQVHQPYLSGVEFHHLNFIVEPKVKFSFLPLYKGKSSPVFVWILRSRLRKLGWRMDDGKGKLLPRGHRFD